MQASEDVRDARESFELNARYRVRTGYAHNAYTMPAPRRSRARVCRVSMRSRVRVCAAPRPCRLHGPHPRPDVRRRGCAASC